ncbi:MAG: T9SS type A sorting domain-containing protein [Bacteroidales bacterium]|nr:T9SS type A sorting domain-containing protein [Bacteroidales bacterium]
MSITKIMIPLLFLLLVFFFQFASAQSDQKMMIIIIDGARYTETFGDPDYSWIPRMKAIAAEGTIISDFRNDGITYTNRAIPALWSGAWTEVRDTVYQGKFTQYSVKPSIFEYYRKYKQESADNCFYILKYLSSLWLPSFDQSYGPTYWPTFYSEGIGDEGVCNNTKALMNEEQPDFMWVYLADVDHAGHSGDWNYYTTTLRRADSIVGVLWDHVQSLPYYQDKTTLIVTNDHGRHDNQHGGFTGHGCGCEGCRRIQFLAVGPNIKQNFTSFQARILPDMAVTAAHILGFEMEKATGQVMQEILKTSSTQEVGARHNLSLNISPNPTSGMASVTVFVGEPSEGVLSIFEITGKLVISRKLGFLQQGINTFTIGNNSLSEQELSPGVYLISLKHGGAVVSDKMIVL